MSTPKFDPSRYLHQPFEVSIETLTLCNAVCTFCPYPTLERKGTAMSDELWSRLVLEMASFKEPFYLSPFKVNEPLLDKKLISRLLNINLFVPQARIRLFSNGSPLTDKKIGDISELENVEHLWISLNSVDPNEYRALMSLDFDRTAEKLDLLHDACKYGDFKHTVMLSRVCDKPWSVIDRAPFELYCMNRWPLFRPFHIKRDGWLGFVPPADPRIPSTPCARWWELSILSNGVVSLCCMDGKGEFPIGDLNRQTMLEVYNSEGWLRRRGDGLPRTRREYAPCNSCTY